MDRRVLFIHPYNHMEPDAVPVGTVGLVNGLQDKALGRFASEVTEDEIREARVVLLDVHWFFPLGILDGMARAIRAVNPAAKIVVGGIASAFYGPEMFSRFDIDFVASGDVELAFRPLVEHLVDGQAPPPLPNVWVRDGAPPPASDRLRAADFDGIDWLSIEWFPSYAEIVRGRHEAYRATLGHSAPLCYPYLPVTRGCRRACDYCYGAYHERVFGRGIRMRSPGALLRDLRTIAANPSLSFVSVLFADEGLMAPYAPALEGARLPLDAYLYFCGNPEPGVIEKIRSGFAGDVSFSIIQASDLASLPTDPPLERQRASTRDLLRSLATMERTGALVYHVNDAPSSAVAELSRETSSVRSESGKDWIVVRPNANDFRPEEGVGPVEQLATIVSAARSASAFHVARLLVPTLRSVLDPTRYRDDLFDAREELDDTARAIADEYRESLRERGVYGFRGLRLDVHVAAKTGRDADWSSPRARLEGEAHWTTGLQGFGWEGEVDAPVGAAAIAVCPSFERWSGGHIELSTWPKALVPSWRIPSNGRRVRFGAATVGPRLAIWADDGIERVEVTLPHGLGLIEAEVVSSARRVRGRDITPECERALWPSNVWPAAVRASVARAFPSATTGLRLGDVRFEPTHVELSLRADTSAISVVVFPRASGSGGRAFLGTSRLAYAYRAESGVVPEDVRRTLGEALERAERAALAADATI